MKKRIAGAGIAILALCLPLTCGKVSAQTAGEVPLVSTLGASEIGISSARLNGRLDPSEPLTTENVSFEWADTGRTSSYNYETPVQTVSAPGNFSTVLLGLSPGTTYRFRARAAGQPKQGDEITFTTLPADSNTPQAPQQAAGSTPEKVVITPYVDLASGAFNTSVMALFDNGKVSLSVARGTTAGIASRPLSTLEITPAPDVPAPDTGFIIGTAYTVGPEKAEFSPNFAIIFNLGALNLPERTDLDNLSIYFLDSAENKWHRSSTYVDRNRSTVTGIIDHAATYILTGTILPPPPPVYAPASFVMTNLTVGTTTPRQGETFSVIATFKNVGELWGQQEYSLSLDDEVEVRKTISLTGGESGNFVFDVSSNVTGIHTLEMCGRGAVVVVEPRPTPTPTSTYTARPVTNPPPWMPVAVFGILGLSVTLFYTLRRRAH